MMTHEMRGATLPTTTPVPHADPAAVFKGKVEYVEKGYGFITGVEHYGPGSGPCPQDVFVRTAALREERTGKSLENLHHRHVRFKVRPSRRHPGKVEAYEVSELSHQHEHGPL